MKNRRLTAVLLAAPLTFMTLGTATAAQAVVPELQVDSLVLSRGSVAVSSLNTVPVTITLEGSTTTSDYSTYYVEFDRSAGTGPDKELYSTPLKLIKGTINDGTWQGVVNVPSTVNGTMKAVSVLGGSHPYGCSQCGFDKVADVDGPALVVTGVHIPKVTGTATPAAVPVGKPVTIKWKVIDSQTGKPYGTKLKTLVATESACADGVLDAALSDVNGVVTINQKSNQGMYCFGFPGNPAPFYRTAIGVDSVPVITAAPAKTSAPVGSVVPVNGTVAYVAGCTVNLQRLYGASQWRTVGTAKVRTSARFTLSAQPSYKGNIPYRVQFPACNNFVAGVSKTFTIKGI
ncbi:hypothetical protein ACFVWG_16930 [Kribbella sp. NPDC058245]|uniref:hypothetical protein n=1 Tax=Kribbella sp. NPDC058245 TaxID=3346399 RepID=UPI0036E52986